MESDSEGEWGECQYENKKRDLEGRVSHELCLLFAGLSFVLIRETITWFPVSLALVSPIASSLAYVPNQSEDSFGLLFFASETGNSIVVDIPQSTLCSAPSGTSLSWTVRQPAAIDNIGPIHDMILIEDTPG